jgi:hypothetical protein
LLLHDHNLLLLLRLLILRLRRILLRSLERLVVNVRRSLLYWHRLRGRLISLLHRRRLLRSVVLLRLLPLDQRGTL